MLILGGPAGAGLIAEWSGVAVQSEILNEWMGFRRDNTRVTRDKILI